MAISVLTATALTACTGHAAQSVSSSPPTARVISSSTTPALAVITGVGMPCLGIMAPAAGFLTPVVLKRGTDVLETQRVRAPFNFRFTVEPGDYVVVGLNDIPARVHATPGSTTTLQLNGDCE